MICQHTWPPGAGQFSLHGYKEYIDFFFQKLHFQFPIIFTEIILEQTSTKGVQRMIICPKHGHRGWNQFSLWLYDKNLKVFSSKTTGPISNLFHRNDPWLDLYQMSSRNDILKKTTWPPVGGPIFLIHLYAKLMCNDPLVNISFVLMFVSQLCN